MNTKLLLPALAALQLSSAAGCILETDLRPEARPRGRTSDAYTAQTSLDGRARLERQGLTDMRGMAYDPGPAPDADGLYGFHPDNVKFPGETKATRWTIYNDADFASADFSSLWGKGPDGNGRDDLRRYKQELNVNFITLYDWDSGSDDMPQTRDHRPFIAYADSLGIKVTAPVTNWLLRGRLCSADAAARTAGQHAVERMVAEIYPDGKPLPGVGMIKVFNEPENERARCPEWRTITADTIAIIQAKEDALHVADDDRLAIFVPVDFGTPVVNGVPVPGGFPGYLIDDVHASIVAHPKLGAEFWRERMVIAVNPFNDGPFMTKWLDTDLPVFEQAHGIPTDTPVIFTEYGKSSTDLGNSVAAQTDYVAGQMALVKKHPTATFMGAAAFASQRRPWLGAADDNYGLLEFGGDGGGWSFPHGDYLAKVLYLNPNGGGAKWDGVYPVQRQTPRPAYWKVADAFKR